MMRAVKELFVTESPCIRAYGGLHGQSAEFPESSTSVYGNQVAHRLCINWTDRRLTLWEDTEFRMYPELIVFNSSACLSISILDMSMIDLEWENHSDDVEWRGNVLWPKENTSAYNGDQRSSRRYPGVGGSQSSGLWSVGRGLSPVLHITFNVLKKPRWKVPPRACEVCSKGSSLEGEIVGFCWFHQCHHDRSWRR